MKSKRGSADDHAKLALRSAATARKAGEAINSAAAVIAARTEMACTQTPLETGLEVNLMVSEKVAAFSEAGAALALLKGSEIDFVDELAGAEFRVRNPNAKSSCGCGVSFSI